MYGRKGYPSMAWLLVQAAIVFCYTSLACCKPYRQDIYQKDKNNNQETNKTILQVTNTPAKHFIQLNKVDFDPSSNSQTQLLESNKDSLKTNAGASLLHESVIFKAIVSNVDVLTLQEENSSSNDVLSKHSTETQQEHKDANGSSSSHKRPSKAHLKWDGHVVAAPLKYDPHSSNFQTPKKVSDTVSTSKMVLSLLTAAAALGSICLTVAIFQCCCRRKRTSDDDEDDDQIESDQCNKEKTSVKPVDTHEQQSVEPETYEKDVCSQQTDEPEETSVETPTEQTTTDGEAVQKDSEEKEEEEEQVSVKDKIKAFETQALKPFSTENAEQHRTLIKRPHSRLSADCESEALSASTTLIMGQVFRKRADTEKCQRKEATSAPENSNTDDYFGMIGRETEVLKSYRRAPAPRNRNKATKALYRKTMPIMDSGGRPNMEINMSDWESTVQSFHQTESPLAKQEPKKKTPIPIPLPNQNVKEDADNKLEDSTEAAKAETKTEGSLMETVSATDTEKLGSARSTGDNTPDASSSGDEASQGEETKIKEEMKEETNKEEEEKKVEKVELKKEEEEEELKEPVKNEEEEELKKEEEEEEKEKQKKEAEPKEEEEKMKEEGKLKEEELNKEKKEKDEEKEKKEKEKEKKEKEKEKKEKEKEKKEKEKEEKEKETELKKEKEKQLKKEKELKREKDKVKREKDEVKREKDEVKREKEELNKEEVKREKEELNKEELKKGKEQLEKEGEKKDNIFFQIDPTAEPTAAKLVKRDSGHESSETSVPMRHRRGDSPKNDQSPKSMRHLSHLDRTTMFLPPGQKPADQMSLMISLKEKLNDKKEKNELDADTDTKMDVDPEPETEKSEAPEC